MSLSVHRQVKRSLDLVKKEIKIKLPLKERGIISEVEFLQLQQREAELEGELEGVQISVPRLQSVIDEATERLEERHWLQAQGYDLEKITIRVSSELGIDPEQ